MKDGEEVVPRRDHRPLRIINVGDCEHRLWDIRGQKGCASGEIPG